MQIPIKLNKPQERLAVGQPKQATSIFSRATGKTFLIALLIRLIIKTMPRSNWMIVGETYHQIKDITLPTTIDALETIGYKRNVHFFLGKKPPAKFKYDLPHGAPSDFSHYLFFWREAVGFHLISQDPGGTSGRGLNVDGVIADEGLLLDKKKFADESTAGNRGRKSLFGHIPWHHGVFIFSSMPYASDGAWLMEHGAYYEKDFGYDFTFLRNEIIKLEFEFVKNKDREIRLNLWKKIRKLKQELIFFQNREGFLYHEADVFDNLENVGVKYIEEQYRVMSDFQFLTEMLNKRPEKIEGGFYPLLDSSKHGYKYSYNNVLLKDLGYNFEKIGSLGSQIDMDCNPRLPLRMAIDWGSKISCMSICQFEGNELRFIKDIFVKRPDLIDELARKFIDYYQGHFCKEIFFIPDVDWGNRSTPDNNLNYNQQLMSKLRAAKWELYEVVIGGTITHHDRYLLWYRYLSVSRDNNPDSLPIVTFNLNNAKFTFNSMANAPAKEGEKGIIKVKASEQSEVILPEDATHYSDCADKQLISIDKHVLYDTSGRLLDRMFV